MGQNLEICGEFLTFVHMKAHFLPQYFRDKYQLSRAVTYAALWSLVFILCSVPFTNNAWFSLGATEAFAYTTAFFLIALSVVILDKWIMYATRNAFRMTYLQYIAWNLGEVVLIALLYTFFTLRGGSMGIIDDSRLSFWRIFFTAAENAFICLMVPYTIVGMSFAISDRNKTIRLMNTRDVVSDEPDKDIQKAALYNVNGDLKFSVKLSNLYYIESSDNYVRVWYADNDGSMKSYMIRSKMKSIEANFIGTSLMRCHRQYIVNMDKVKLLRKEKDKYEIELDNEKIPPISVTKTYLERILENIEKTGKGSVQS